MSDLTMDRIYTLPGKKGIAISARTGSGNSSICFGSRHVLRVLVADTGSGAHAIYKRPEAECVDIIADNPKESPVQQAMRLVKKWTEEGYLWAVDSFSTLMEQQVAWHKRFRTDRQQMSLREHQHVVGDLRDLALFLASRSGFTIFNTSPGGQQRTPEGNVVNMPKGVLVGYASLSGLAEGKESVLSRFTSSWIITPGGIATKDRPRIARGFILAENDIRGGEVGNFAPIKDPLRVLKATEAFEGEGEDRRKIRDEEVDAFLSLDSPICTIDAMLERIAAQFPHIRDKPARLVNQPAQQNSQNQPPQLGVVKGGEAESLNSPAGQTGGERRRQPQAAQGGGNRA